MISSLNVKTRQEISLQARYRLGGEPIFSPNCTWATLQTGRQETQTALEERPYDYISATSAKFQAKTTKFPYKYTDAPRL